MLFFLRILLISFPLYTSIPSISQHVFSSSLFVSWFIFPSFHMSSLSFLPLIPCPLPFIYPLYLILSPFVSLYTLSHPLPFLAPCNPITLLTLVRFPSVSPSCLALNFFPPPPPPQLAETQLKKFFYFFS